METTRLNMLHGSITPGRFGYFREVLTRQRNGQVRGLRALDIGCGGGLLAEQFAALGCQVTGVDPSPGEAWTLSGLPARRPGWLRWNRACKIPRPARASSPFLPRRSLTAPTGASPPGPPGPQGTQTTAVTGPLRARSIEGRLR